MGGVFMVTVWLVAECSIAQSKPSRGAPPESAAKQVEQLAKEQTSPRTSLPPAHVRPDSSKPPDPDRHPEYELEHGKYHDAAIQAVLELRFTLELEKAVRRYTPDLRAAILRELMSSRTGIEGPKTQALLVEAGRAIETSYRYSWRRSSPEAGTWIATPLQAEHVRRLQEIMDGCRKDQQDALHTVADRLIGQDAGNHDIRTVLQQRLSERVRSAPEIASVCKDLRSANVSIRFMMLPRTDGKIILRRKLPPMMESTRARYERQTIRMRDVRTHGL